MKEIQLGIVGAGLIWEKTHKQKLKMLKSIYEIRAFSVRSESTKNKLRKEYPDSEIYSDYHEMLKLDYLDAIVVLTPIQLNAAVTIEALRADKYVFVEKPVATSLDDVGEIIDLEKKTQKKVFVLEQIRYNENLKKLKRILDEGKIGTVVSYERVNHGKIGEGKNNFGGFGNTDWRISPNFRSGLCLTAVYTPLHS
jgi:predicted dehydrogenase